MPLSTDRFKLLHSLVNGQASNVISIQDRGLLYGDGCFETLRVNAGKPLLLDAHIARLEEACTALSIDLDIDLLSKEFSTLLASNSPQGVLKIIVTRGSGGRGYRPDPNAASSRIVQFFDYPTDYQQKQNAGVEIMQCLHRLASSRALAGLKHLNRLDQVLASRELVEPFDEGLCLDQAGNVIEATRSNLLLVLEGRLITPDLSECGVKGIMLQYLRRRFSESGIEIHSRIVKPEEIAGAQEIFLCNSVFGVWPVIKLLGNATVTSWSVGATTLQAIQYNNELLGPAS